MRYIEYTSHLAVAMGGRVAEELIFGKDNITSGAAGDIQQATAMARSMVTQLGYSDELGTVMYGSQQEEVFLGMSMGRQQNMSDETAKKVDAAVKKLIDQGTADARKILTEKRDQLEAVAQALLEFETLTGDELKTLLAGGKIDRPDDDQPSTPRGTAVPTTGKGRPKPEPDAGMEPQPQG
jgi:cell division protease FtsH